MDNRILSLEKRLKDNHLLLLDVYEDFNLTKIIKRDINYSLVISRNKNFKEYIKLFYYLGFNQIYVQIKPKLINGSYIKGESESILFVK